MVCWRPANISRPYTFRLSLTDRSSSMLIRTIPPKNPPPGIKMTHASSLAFDELPRTTGGVGATDRIARALHDSGIDAPSHLYDEALALAREGRLAPSTERLRMLLVLDPSDAEASLLLGKVLAARGMWQDALSYLDSAAANGAVLPPGLRDTVEVSLRKKVQDAEEHRSRVAARERGEIRNLRAEAKRLRSENAVFELQVEELRRRIKLWSSLSALIAGSASAFFLGTMIFGGDAAVEPISDGPATEEIAEINPTETAKPLLVTPAVDTLASTATPEPNLNTPTTEVQNTIAAPVIATPPVAPTPVVKEPTATIHTVKSGDTLGKISKKYYGKSGLWPTIQKANKEVLNGSENLSLGMKLTIPPNEN